MSQSDKPKWNDRHNISKPNAGLGKTDTEAAAAQKAQGQTVQWAGWRNGCKDRIGDLFKTVGGLPSHVNALQSSFTSLSNGVKKNEIEAEKAKGLFREMCDSIRKAADGTVPTDITPTTTWSADFSCPEIGATYNIQRLSTGKIIHAYSG